MIENKTIGELLLESQEYMNKTGEILEAIHRRSQDGMMILDGRDIPEMRELLVVYGQYRQLHMVLAEAMHIYEEIHQDDELLEEEDELQEAVMMDEQQLQEEEARLMQMEGEDEAEFAAPEPEEAEEEEDEDDGDDGDGDDEKDEKKEKKKKKKIKKDKKSKKKKKKNK